MADGRNRRVSAIRHLPSALMDTTRCWNACPAPDHVTFEPGAVGDVSGVWLYPASSQRTRRSCISTPGGSMREAPRAIARACRMAFPQASACSQRPHKHWMRSACFSGSSCRLRPDESVHRKNIGHAHVYERQSRCASDTGGRLLRPSAYTIGRRDKTTRRRSHEQTPHCLPQ